MLAIVGESGSGKTVTAAHHPRAAAGDGHHPRRGPAHQQGRRQTNDVVTLSGAQLREVRGRDAAMVFQEPSTALNPVYTVGWQIAEGLRAARRATRSKEARAKAIDVLRRVGIPDPEHRVDHYPHQFSGGQKQRIVIALALVLDPGVIIADEPTTALDVTVQAEILDLLRRCRDEFGTAIVLITHNMGVVADLADRVAVMYQGEIVEQADVRTLFAAPQEDYTQQLLAAVPRSARAPRAPRERAAGRPAGWAAAPPVVEARDLRIVYPGRLRRPTSSPSTASTSRSGPARCSAWSARAAAGKTTIGRAIAGLTKVTGGSLQVLGAGDERRQGARRSGRCASGSGSSSRTRRRASTRC